MEKSLIVIAIRSFGIGRAITQFADGVFLLWVESPREALESIDDQNIGAVIKIRGEPHTIPQAVTRSITHLSYHVGQITMIIWSIMVIGDG
ncbi:MAG: DUF1572 family protein [Pirellulales bacterium]